MASISGQNTTNIDQVDGFFTTQGGGELPESVISGTGVQLSANSEMPWNPGITADFNLSPVANHVFVRVAVQQQWSQAIGIKADGTLWYIAKTTTYGQNFFTTLNAWTQYGTDTDWEDVTSSSLNWGFLKGGDYYFMGYGGYGMAGNGTTTTTSSPTLTSTALSFSKVRFGFGHTVLLTTTGEVYTCGQNNDYATGLGVNSGNTLALTRESASLTGVTDIAASYRTTRIVTGGNIYSSGNNQFNHAGPLIASASPTNGPTLGYNGGDINKVWTARNFTIGTTATGEVRHAGNGFGRRVDGSNVNLTGWAGQPNEQFTLLTAGGTGWSSFSFPTATSGASLSVYAIQNGEVYMSTDTALSAEGWGLPPNTAQYQRIGTFNTATCAEGSFVSTAYPRNAVISVS